MHHVELYLYENDVKSSNKCWGALEELGHGLYVHTEGDKWARPRRARTKRDFGERAFQLRLPPFFSNRLDILKTCAPTCQNTDSSYSRTHQRDGLASPETDQKIIQWMNSGSLESWQGVWSRLRLRSEVVAKDRSASCCC